MNERDLPRGFGMRRRPVGTWHVVVSQGGAVLGVYGEALLSGAQEQAREVERTTGFPAFVQQVRGARPRVGDGCAVTTVAARTSEPDAECIVCGGMFYSGTGHRRIPICGPCNGK